MISFDLTACGCLISRRKRKAETQSEPTRTGTCSQFSRWQSSPVTSREKLLPRGIEPSEQPQEESVMSGCVLVVWDARAGRQSEKSKKLRRRPNSPKKLKPSVLEVALGDGRSCASHATDQVLRIGLHSRRTRTESGEKERERESATLEVSGTTGASECPWANTTPSQRADFWKKTGSIKCLLNLKRSAKNVTQ